MPKQTYVPDCDTTKLIAIYPCKVPVYKNGKTVGYTVRELPYQLISESTVLFSGLGIYSPSYHFEHYHYIQFTNQWGNWWIDEPDSAGKVKIHIQRKQLKFINDSTAIYTPKK